MSIFGANLTNVISATVSLSKDEIIKLVASAARRRGYTDVLVEAVHWEISRGGYGTIMRVSAAKDGKAASEDVLCQRGASRIRELLEGEFAAAGYRLAGGADAVTFEHKTHAHKEIGDWCYTYDLTSFKGKVVLLLTAPEALHVDSANSAADRAAAA